MTKVGGKRYGKGGNGVANAPGVGKPAKNFGPSIVNKTGGASRAIPSFRPTAKKGKSGGALPKFRASVRPSTTLRNISR